MPANQALLKNKEIQWAAMVRSKLRNQFLKSRSIYDKKACNKQIKEWFISDNRSLIEDDKLCTNDFETSKTF